MGLTLSCISSCNHLRCTHSNSCNWRVATKLYISPWLPHCRLFAALMSWSWSANNCHWHHNQYLCNWHINHSRSPSKHVCTVHHHHQHWSASWLVGTLISFVKSRLTIQRNWHCSQFQACVHRHQQACHWVARVGWGCTGQSGCTENYSTNTFSTGFLPLLCKVGWLSKRVDSFLL